MLGKLLIDMVICRATSGTRLTIQTKLGLQKDNSQTFVIFVAFCVNSLSLLWESGNGLEGAFQKLQFQTKQS